MGGTPIEARVNMANVDLENSIASSASAADESTLRKAHPRRNSQQVNIPAVIFCEVGTAELSVAGLSVLDRLVVAASRAGVRGITLISQRPPTILKRASALGIEVQHSTTRPELTGPTLVLSTQFLIQAPELRRLIDNGGCLVTREGIPLPTGVLDSLSEAPLDNQLSNLPAITAEGFAEPLTDARSAKSVTGKLWASLTSSADGFVDRHFNRPIGRLLSKILVHTPVSPNQVSIAATLLGLLSAWLFARGDHRGALWGAVLLQVSAIVDCVDGDLARVLFKESPLGKWLDIVGDQVVHIGVFVAIGIGLYRVGSDAPVLALATSAAIGVVISFLIVLRGLLQPEALRNTRLQKLIEATTNRDFSVLLLVLVLVRKLEWFLWLTAVGVHVFWILALGVQMLNQPAATTLDAQREKRS